MFFAPIIGLFTMGKRKRKKKGQNPSDNIFLPLYRLDLSNEIMSLHIGDKILEVNGTPIKDQPIENIENLMKNSNSVLQVGTLEFPYK